MFVLNMFSTHRLLLHNSGSYSDYASYNLKRPVGLLDSGRMCSGFKFQVCKQKCYQLKQSETNGVEKQFKLSTHSGWDLKCVT